MNIPKYGDVANGVFVGSFWNNRLESDNDIGKFARTIIMLKIVHILAYRKNIQKLMYL